MCLGGGSTRVTNQPAPLSPEQQETIRVMLDALRARNALIQPLFQRLGFSITPPSSGTPSAGISPPPPWPTDFSTMPIDQALARAGFVVGNNTSPQFTSPTAGGLNIPIGTPFGSAMQQLGFDPSSTNPSDFFRQVSVALPQAQGNSLVQNAPPIFALPPTAQQQATDLLHNRILASALLAQQHILNQQTQYPAELSRLLALTQALQPRIQ